MPSLVTLAAFEIRERSDVDGATFGPLVDEEVRALFRPGVNAIKLFGDVIDKSVNTK